MSALQDLLTYLALAALATAAGRGVLRLLRARLPSTTAWLLGAPVTLALWTVALGVAVQVHLPVRAAVAPLGLVTLLLARVGLRGAGRRAWRTAVPGALLVCAALPAVTLAPHALRGLRDFAGVFRGDGWSYVADAQYVWAPRQQGLSVLHAYATTLSETRHSTAALLAALSPLERAGDTQRAVGLLLGFELFVYACACASLGRGRRRLACVLIAVPGGWVGHALALSNYDQVLALALMPAAFSLLGHLGRRGGGLIAAGLLLGALVYAYPESAPILAVAWVLGAVALAWRRARGRERLLAAGGAALVALALAVPYAPTLVRFLGWQSLTLHGGRPGGTLFASLLEPRHALTGLWGLDSEDPRAIDATGWVTHGLALLLTLFAVLGAWSGRHARTRGLTAVALVHAAGAAVLLLGLGYHYGAYKLLSLGTWCFAYLAWRGAETAARRVAGASPGPVVWTLTLATALHSAASPGQQRLRATAVPEGLDFGRLRALEDVAARLRPRGVAVDLEVGAVQQWAAYFLRGVPLRYADYQGYLAVEPTRLRLADAARPRWEDVDYVLGAATLPPGAGSGALELAADLPPLRLWRLRGDTAWTRTARSSTGALELTLQLRRSGVVRLRAALAGHERATHVRVRTENAVVETPVGAGGHIDVALPLPAGPGLVQIEALDGGHLRTKAGISLGLEDAAVCPPSGLRPSTPARGGGDGGPWFAQDAQGRVQVWRARAAGARLSGWVAPAPKPTLRLVGSGDVDGDGLPDLALQGTRHGEARLWLLGGDGAPRTAEMRLAPRAPGRRARLAAVADLNSDGRADLVWQDDRSAFLDIQLACGAGWRPSVPLQPGRPDGPSWRLTAAGDVDGDGRADLLWGHPRQARALVWYMDGLRPVGSAWLDPPDGDSLWWPVGAGPRRSSAGDVSVLWQRRDSALAVVDSTRDGRLLARRDLLAPGTAPGDGALLGAARARFEP